MTPHSEHNHGTDNYRPLEIDWEHLALEELLELDWPNAEGNELAPVPGTARPGTT